MRIGGFYNFLNQRYYTCRRQLTATAATPRPCANHRWLHSRLPSLLRRNQEIPSCTDFSARSAKLTHDSASSFMLDRAPMTLCLPAAGVSLPEGVSPPPAVRCRRNPRVPSGIAGFFMGASRLRNAISPSSGTPTCGVG